MSKFDPKNPFSSARSLATDALKNNKIPKFEEREIEPDESEEETPAKPAPAVNTLPVTMTVKKTVEVPEVLDEAVKSLKKMRNRELKMQGKKGNFSDQDIIIEAVWEFFNKSKNRQALDTAKRELGVE